MEAIGVCGSGVFFERENEFFGMSMSTDWERDDGVVYTGSIDLVRSWTTTGRYGTFLSKTLFLFPYCNSRQNQSRLLHGHGPACHIRSFFCYSLSPPCSFLG